MTVLVIYDGWQNLRFVDVVAVIVGPVLAMFLSHVFAGALAQQVALGRRPTNHERLRIVASESRFLLLAVPPLAIVSLLTLLGVSLNDSIRCVTVLGALSLGFWGGLAGRRSGSSGWALVLAVLAGLAVGGLVLALQIVLQPGKAASGGAL
jgi:VanZ family protein